jgi:hypothetical protein
MAFRIVRVNDVIRVRKLASQQFFFGFDWQNRLMICHKTQFALTDRHEVKKIGRKVNE